MILRLWLQSIYPVHSGFDFANRFWQNHATVLYALGRTKEKGRETYLFVKAVQAKKRVAYLACFDKDNNI